MRVLAITRNPYSESFENRVIRHLQALEDEGIHVTVRMYPQSMSERRMIFRKAVHYDVVWWHKHLLPRGWQKKLRRRANRLIFDFDTPPWPAKGKSRMSLSDQWKFHGMLRVADAVFVASDSQTDLVGDRCANVHTLPTAVTPTARPTHGSQDDKVNLLWAGSLRAQDNLELIRPVLEQLGSQRDDVRLIVVGHNPVEFKGLPVEFERWSSEQVDNAMLISDIGLCPLPATRHGDGLVPYRVVRYMSAGLPWVGSASRANLAFAAADETHKRGLAVSGESAWLDALNTLIDNPELRRQLGSRGREHVIESHNEQKLAEQLRNTLRTIRDNPRRKLKRFSFNLNLKRRQPGF